MSKTLTTVYADHAATTPLDARVLNSISNASLLVGNAASTTHRYGEAARQLAETSRESISRMVGAIPFGVILTSGATESNNLAVLGCLRAAGSGSHVICSAVEHRAVLDPVNAISREGYDVTLVPVDEFGAVSVDNVVASITPRTVLVSIIFANNEVGTINPIAEIGAVCRERGILFHTDATQVAGKVFVDLAKLPIDLMSFSAHKIYGPTGIGALYINRDRVVDRIKPIMFGGGHERGLRPGTMPIPPIAGFAKACELCGERMEVDAKRIATLRDHLWHRFQAEIPDIVMNGHPTKRLYNNLNASFQRVPSEAFMVKLRDVVAVSAGSACTSTNPEPSHVLRAMGIHSDRLDSAIRFSLGRFNTMEEMDFVADHVRDAVAELRQHM